MFGKASRFPPEKPSDVPGPNHYTLPEQEGWDAYKKGAFLEKADRFQKEKPYEGPDSIPSTSEESKPKKDASKPAKKPDAPSTAGQADTLKYIALRKELDELQRIHDDGKKAHRLETQQLKTELERLKKTSSDQGAVLRKQVEMADAKTQDSKKALLSAQTEINELRLKLRAQEKEKATATSSELSQAKKASTTAEAARRELELKVADMEKTLQWEKRKRDAEEAKVKESTDQVEELSNALKSTQSTVTSLEKERDSLTTRLAQASRAASQADTETNSKLTVLQEELGVSRDLLRVCAEAYGSMFESTAPKPQLESLRVSRAEAFSRLIKLERRLADKDAQLMELVAYTRHKDEQINLLRHSLEDSEGELTFLRSLVQTNAQDSIDAQSWPEQPLENSLMESILAQSDAQLASALEEYHQEWIRTLINEYKTAGHVASSLEAVLGKVLEQTASLDGQLQVAQVESEAARKRAREADELAGSLENTAQDLKEERDRLLQQLAERKASLSAEVIEGKKQVEESRKRTERLDMIVKEKTAAEKALNDEIETLSNDLRDALRYEHAYKALSTEVDALVVRNELVEREADHLSRFNAEILGHTNPNQKIHYLDRIRRDLADTKHKLAVSTQQRETVLEDNDTLRNELYAYRTVSDSKPKSANVTRVARAPLSMSVNGTSPNGGTNPPRASGGSSSLGSQERAKPMTIEELM